MKLHWMNYWMMLHTVLFYTLVFMALFKIEGLFGVEWATLIQLWIWNLFAYLYVVFMNYMRIMRNQYTSAAIAN